MIARLLASLCMFVFAGFMFYCTFDEFVCLLSCCFTSTETIRRVRDGRRRWKRDFFYMYENELQYTFINI